MQDDRLSRMRSDWDHRANLDAKHYIATGMSDEWMFGLSGLRDANAIINDVYPLLSRDGPVLEDADEEVTPLIEDFLARHPLIAKVA